MTPRRAPGTSRLVAALLVAGALPAAEEPGPSPFSWRSTYGDALGAALQRGTPFVLYFPPLDTAAEHPALRFPQRVLGVPPVVEGVRVGADEVLDLKERFRVKEVPAVLLIDRRENAVHRWEGRIPANVWALVETLARRLEKREAEDRKVVEEGLALAARGDVAGAYRRVAALLESGRAAPEALAGAREIEARIVAAGRRRMLEALAPEGLVPDADLAKSLAALREEETHPRVRAEIAREIDRLRERKLGARG